MRSNFLIGAALFIAVMSLGCPQPKPYSQPPKTLNIEGGKAYVNKQSGFVFPATVENFQRVEVTQYAADELDVGVGYNDYANGIVMTVYDYPKPSVGPDSTLEQHFERCKSEIMQHSQTRLVSEGPVEIQPEASTRTGLRAVYSYSAEFAYEWQPVVSELYVFAEGDRYIKYRVTYPASREASAPPVVRAFMNELEWP